MRKFESINSKLIIPVKTRRRTLEKKQNIELRRKSRSPFKAELSSKTHFSMFLNYTEGSFSVLIPPTLITMNNLNKQFFFYYKEGHMHMETGHLASRKFFEICRDGGTSKYKHPKFIQFSHLGIWLHASEEEAKQSQVNTDMSLLQKFVHPDKKYSKKLRIMWKRFNENSYWEIKNMNALTKTQLYSQQTSNRIQHSAYMYKLKEFSHAGRLLKTSFSPFNLYQSKLNTTHKQTLSSQAIHLNVRDKISRKSSFNINKINLSIHLSKQSDKFNTISIEHPIKYPKLEKMIENFIEIFDRWTENIGFPPIKKASFDFVEDLKGKWNFIGCKFPGIDMDSYLQSINLKRVQLNGTVLMKQSNLKEEIKADNEKYKQKFFEIKQRLVSINCKPANLIENEKNSVISFYKTLPIHEPLNLNTKKNSEQRLSPIAQLYDVTIEKARELKKRSKLYSDLNGLLEGNENFTEAVLDEIFEDLGKNEMFGLYLKQGNRGVYSKEFIRNCIEGKKFNDKMKAKDIIKDLGVNRRNFQEFVFVLDKVLGKFFDENLKELLLERIVEEIKI